MEIAVLENIAAQVRRDIIRMIHGAKSGHPGGSLGCADLLTALYFQIMDIDPSRFPADGVGEDMFFLSNGHISAAWYSVLARRGYFPVSELGTFRKMGSRLQGHPTPAEHLPGIRVASGSLGQGLSIAIGATLAKKANEDPHDVFVLLGDGELEEGQNWEAILFAAAKNVDNLVAIVDYNGKQIDGTTDEVCSLGDLRAKFETFNWLVFEINGNNMKETVSALSDVKNLLHRGRPVVVLAHTEMGMGVDFMMGTHKWHGTPPSDEQAREALLQLPETIGDY
ncbi:MAG: transketolase [Bacteroidales bacterium]|jgi:transketolase|nr:transketolase [Bacteroidales bacterium]